MEIRYELGLQDDVSWLGGATLNLHSNKGDMASLARKSSIFWETLLIGIYKEYEKSKNMCL